MADRVAVACADEIKEPIADAIENAQPNRHTLKDAESNEIIIPVSNPIAHPNADAIDEPDTDHHPLAGCDGLRDVYCVRRAETNDDGSGDR
jgi:hypothetical protein